MSTGAIRPASVCLIHIPITVANEASTEHRRSRRAQWRHAARDQLGIARLTSSTLSKKSASAMPPARTRLLKSSRLGTSATRKRGRQMKLAFAASAADEVDDLPRIADGDEKIRRPDDTDGADSVPEASCRSQLDPQSAAPATVNPINVVAVRRNPARCLPRITWLKEVQVNAAPSPVGRESGSTRPPWSGSRIWKCAKRGNGVDGRSGGIGLVPSWQRRWNKASCEGRSPRSLRALSRAGPR